MRRITLVAVLALGGLFATAGTAGADVGDVRFLSVNNQLFGSASEVDVTGQIRCAASIDYGLIAAVAQDPNEDPFDTFGANNGEYGNGPAGPNASAEGVGAFGPNFDPPVGINDDSPCSQSLSSYDVLVQQNRDSGDFFGTQNNPSSWRC